MPSNLFLLNDNVQDTRQAAQTSFDAIESAIDGLEVVTDVLEVLEEIDTNAETLRDIAQGLKNAMTLVSKVGPPLSSVAPLLKRVITQVEERAEQVENGIDVESDFGAFRTKVETLINGLETARDGLEVTIAELEAIENGVSDAATGVEEAFSIPVELQNALNQANIIAGNLNDATSGIAALATDINDLEARIDGVFGTFPDSARTLINVARDFTDMIGKVDFLQTPMNALNDALEPIQWALDAVEAVIERVINPVLDPILDSLGVTDLFDQMADAINSLLPEISLFTGIDTDLVDFNVEFGELAVQTPGLDIASETDLMARMRDDIDRLTVEMRKLITPFDPLGITLDNNANLAIGYDGFGSRDPNGIIAGGTNIFAQGGDDLISGGLGGDVLNGGLGNDILIGGAGDDIIDGGTGIDGVILQGFLSEFSFKRDTVTNAIIVSHTHGAPGAVDLGTDVISNVTYFMFKERTLNITDFDFFYEAANGETEGDGISLASVPNGPARDFMFGTDNAEEINSYALMDYITARGGNDTLNGGTGDDFLEGGSGFDSIVGGGGIDVGSYLGEAGSAHFASLLPAGDARQPFVSEDTYISVEHLTGSDNDDWLWGDDTANRLDGRGGDDVLRGLMGDDSLISGEGRDMLIGGGGNDTLVATGVDYDPTDPSTIGQKVFVAGTGNDVYLGERGNFSSLYYGGVDFSSVFAAFPTLASVGLDSATIAATMPHRIDMNGAAGTIQKFSSTGTLIGTDNLFGHFRVYGANGNDQFTGSAEQEFLFGGGGNDTFDGGARNFRPIWDAVDPQNSFAVNDFYSGGDGNDLFRPVEGRTNILAGEGDDTVEVSAQGWLLLSGSDNDTDQSETDTLDFSGSDLGWIVDLHGSYIGDPLKLGYKGVAEGHESGTIVMPDETNFASFDSLQRQLGQPGASFDMLLGESYLEIQEFEAVTGTQKDDFIAGNERANILRGGAGNDVIFGHAGTAIDRLFGDQGDDTLIGSTANDLLSGGAGNDDLRNAAGVGQAGGQDLLIGGGGNDILRVFEGYIQVDLQGDAGADTADFSDHVGAITLTLGQSASAINPIGITGVENLRGTQSGDELTGDDQGNEINGMDGDDLIDGELGNDILFAGLGQDTLRGGVGNDLLVVGPGGGQMDGGTGVDTASFGPNQMGDLSDGSANWQPTQTLGQAAANLQTGFGTFTEFGTGVQHAYVLSEIENLTGTLSHDNFSGDAIANQLSGDAGNDTLIGRGGDDVLSGGDGNDVLTDGGTAQAFALNQGGTSDQMLGLNGYTEMPGGSFTMDILFRSTAEFGAVDAPLISYAVPGSDNEVLIYANNNANGFEIWINQQLYITQVSPEPLFDGAEHRLSLSADVSSTGRFTLYLDGAAIHTEIAGLPGFGGLVSGGSLVIGQEQDAVNGGFNTVGQFLTGEVAEVRVWDYAMAQSDVQDFAFAPISNPAGTAGLVSLWQPDSASGNMTDLTGGAALSPRTTGGTGTPPQIVTYAEGGNDTMNGGAGEDLVDGGNGHDLLYGGSGDDTLNGGRGNDTLDGGAGADQMAGGLGSDTYVVDDAGDTVTEIGADTDTVRSSVTFSLVGQPLETLVLTGTGNINGTGNSFGNMITGNSGNNVIGGGSGADMMAGGLGDDTYIVDNVGDTVTEIGGGLDTVESTINFSLLGAAVERLILTGSAVNGTGNSLNNSLFGTSAANVLSGGSGSDFISAGGGSDVLHGESGNDTLDGGTGADTMAGGLGDDTYIVDNVGDTVTETGTGTDTVQSTVDFSLVGAAVEHLILMGSAVTGTGNSLANSLLGTAAANVLSGGAGADTLNGGGGADMMDGGLGDDIYMVDNTGDTVIETGNGLDTVESTVDFSLVGAAVERLILKGSAVTGNGNSLNNSLFGTGGGNVFSGGSGNDFISSGGGSDVLRGEAGNDTLDGGSAFDFLDGGTGADLMRGGAGSDIYVVDNVGDMIEDIGELTDIDTVRASVSFSLLGQPLDNLELQGSGDINGTGNGLANMITGNSGANKLLGGGGQDTLNGGLGNDTLEGGTGGDALFSSAGKDLFWGDQAGDVFVFTDAGHIGNSNAERDVIFDFQQGSDKINLVGIDAITGGADDAFSFIGATAFTGTAGELRASAIATNTLIEGDLDGNGTGDFQLVLIGNYVLNGGDFFL